ncbi:MAG: glycosyltransferase [Prevotella sp.]|jgi:hypothetical protein|nr:glycosyltransferase [Prevotella sp.]
MLAPIVLFVYNRPSKTKETLEALASNTLAEESVLYIFSDGPKKDADLIMQKEITETRRVLRQKQWCGQVHIIESEKNNGLANSIEDGITRIVNQYGKVIVLEDDIVTSPYFLTYMNAALDLYEKEDKVMHISGFVPVTTGANKLPETYFLRFMSCWGWATWKRAWDKRITDIPYLYKSLPVRSDFHDFNLNGSINQFSQIEQNYEGTLKTWAIKWYATIFINNGLCLYPHKSLVDNIGVDGSGTNSIALDNRYNVDLAGSIVVNKIPIKENKYAKKYLQRFYIYGKDSSWEKRLKRYLKSTSLHYIYKNIRYK